MEDWLHHIYEHRVPCVELGLANAGETVCLTGWALRYRDQGGLIFVDLRDRSGIVQLVFDRSICADYFDAAGGIRNEFVLAVQGPVRKRIGDANPKLRTGEIEVLVHRLEILNPARTPPISLEDFDDISEELRLRYRFLDLRRSAMKEALLVRSRLNQSLRRYLEGDGFVEVETPILNKSTPEGARDFLVPVRLSPGNFYALPQSPQIFKQLLMVGGLERYFQIVKCFRDEDLRADRQPEFTQLDMEFSFVDQEVVLLELEKLWRHVLDEVFDVKLQTPLPRMTYADAMERFGVDCPDLRFGMELCDIADIVGGGEFTVFSQVLEKKGRVKAICVPGGTKLSRKDIDELTAWLGRSFGASGLAYMKHEADGLKTGISKFFSDEVKARLIKRCGSKPGDILFFAADREKVVHAALGNLRLRIGERLGLIDGDRKEFLWVVDFPLFERDGGKFTSVHHPFTAPREEDLPILLDPERLEKEGEKVISQGYDLVMNGSEIGGGSIRIHREAVQQAVFRALGISEEEAQEKFGFLLDALKHGSPPHGGVAFGLDRVMMLFLKRESIRDVIAFPKTQKGTCLMSNSPSGVTAEQLAELKLQSLVKDS